MGLYKGISAFIKKDQRSFPPSKSISVQLNTFVTKRKGINFTKRNKSCIDHKTRAIEASSH